MIFVSEALASQRRQEFVWFIQRKQENKMIKFDEALKDIRQEAKKVGLLFKRKNTKLNGAYLWCFEDKRRGDIALNNCQFWAAYENACSGYIASFDAETGYFKLKLNNNGC